MIKKQHIPTDFPFRCFQQMSLFTILMVAMSLTALPAAQATAIAEADIQAQLTVSLPTNGIEFAFFDAFAITDTIENGNASATGQAPDPVDLGTGIQLGARATATSTPLGSAFGVGAAFGSFELTNTTSNPINVDLTLVQEWIIRGSADDPSLEQAQAEIALDLFINNVLLAQVIEDNATPPNFTIGSGNVVTGPSMTQMFSNFSIPSGTTFVEISVAAQAEVNSAAVPEPSMLLLFGSGMVGIALYRWKRRK